MFSEKSIIFLRPKTPIIFMKLSFDILEKIIYRLKTFELKYREKIFNSGIQFIKITRIPGL